MRRAAFRDAIWSKIWAMSPDDTIWAVEKIAGHFRLFGGRIMKVALIGSR
jgi:hypothetical protein